MKLSRFTYTFIGVIAIGLVLSFALCRGDKAELNYYDFAEPVRYNTDRDGRGYARYAGIGLSEEKRNEIQNIFSNFDSSVFFDHNPSPWKGPGVRYHIIIKIKNNPYLITVYYCEEDIEGVDFLLEKINKFDGRFYYREDETVSKFKNRELLKKLDEFIQENKKLIIDKRHDIREKGRQPKYASPMIQKIHERYCETADEVEDWAYNLYYDLYYDVINP